MEFGSLVIIAVAAPVSGTPCSAEKVRRSLSLLRQGRLTPTCMSSTAPSARNSSTPSWSNTSFSSQNAISSSASSVPSPLGSVCPLSSSRARADGSHGDRC